MIRQRISGAARNIAALLCAFLFGGGCTSVNVYVPEHLLMGPQDQITVHLKDGRTIRFREDEYRILDADGGSLQGRGELVTGKVNNATIPWEGTITFGEMQSVSTTHLNFLGYSGLVVLGAGALLFFTVLLIGGSHWN
jgi:hypothetical protein